MSSRPAALSRLLPDLAAFAREVLDYAGPKAKWAAAAVTAGAFLESAGVLLIVPLLGIVVGSGEKSGKLRFIGEMFSAAGLRTPVTRLVALLAVFAVIMAVRAIVISYRDITLAGLQIGFAEHLRGRVAEKLARAEWTDLVALRHARITHVMSGDVQRIGSATHFLIQLTLSLVLIVAQSALAFYLSPALATLAFVLIVISIVAMIPMLKRTHALSEYLTQSNLTLLNSTAQFLGALKMAISQNLQDAFVAEFDLTLRDISARQIANSRQNTNRRLVTTTLSAFVGGSLVLIGFALFHVPTPVLITILIVIGRMSGPANQIQMSAQQLVSALPAFKAVKALELDLGKAKRPAAGSYAAPNLPAGPIVFDRVTFIHPADGEDGEERGVRAISVRIADGEFLGIVGTSGSGKTTFADLLVTLLQPQAGEISVGGCRLDEPAFAAWRDSVSYVSQDPFLFHDTVRKNLGWASPHASEAEMWDMLALTGAVEIVKRLSHGLDTVLGERGTLISGGERQRIALARALLRHPRLLILDEATSAIDIPGERAILERLANLPSRPTIVMIAHRPQSLARCTRVLTMENGRLSETPSPAEATPDRLHVPQKV